MVHICVTDCCIYSLNTWNSNSFYAKLITCSIISLICPCLGFQEPDRPGAMNLRDKVSRLYSTVLILCTWRGDTLSWCTWQRSGSGYLAGAVISITESFPLDFVLIIKHYLSTCCCSKRWRVWRSQVFPYIFLLYMEQLMDHVMHHNCWWDKQEHCWVSPLKSPQKHHSAVDDIIANGVLVNFSILGT